MFNLKTKLQRFNKCKYHLYQGLIGIYQFEKFTMTIDYVQPDPFAPPSKITIKIPYQNTFFDTEYISNSIRQVAFCDFLARYVARHIRTFTKDGKGSGNGGFCGIRYGMQKIIESNAVIIRDNQIELKFLVGLPAFGRTIASKEASETLLHEIPTLIEHSVLEAKTIHEDIQQFITVAERQAELRQLCQREGIVSFIANDSILARASSVDDKPMSHQKAKAFISPKQLEKTFTLSDGFKITGMAIPKGITLITGGGFHGKSTLLSAISHAIYNHIPQDGREYCITDENAVFLRSEEGRYVEGIDISPFIHHLPNYQSSKFFQTENASGSSSQATNLIESCEMGSSLLLIDEDIAATNFLIRDMRMRSLVPDYKETITPLIAHVPNLKKKGISIIMVTGALGDFMSVADKVIVADNYEYTDETERALKIIAQYPLANIEASAIHLEKNRVIEGNSVQYIGKKGMAIINGEQDKVYFGREIINMSAWNHLHDVSQYGTLAAVLAYAQDKKYFDNQTPQSVWDRVSQDITKYGWDIFATVGLDHLSTRQLKRQDKNPKPITNNWRYIVKTRPLDWHATLCRLRSVSCQSLENNS